MNFSGKKNLIKEVQEDLLLEADGKAGDLTWRAIEVVTSETDAEKKKDIVKAVQKFFGLLDDGKDGLKTWTAIREYIAGKDNQKQEDEEQTEEDLEESVVEDNDCDVREDKIKYQEVVKPFETSNELHHKGIAFIAKYEISSKSYYNKCLKSPTYPGGASGVTIGIGYDLGHTPENQFRRDWRGKLPTGMFRKLSSVLTIKGRSAKGRINSLSNIEIPYDVALDVFENSTVQVWYAKALRVFPALGNLHPDAQTALVSLCFNRGASLTGTNREGMADIATVLSDVQKELTVEDYKKLAQIIVDMKPIWEGRGLDGLLARRDAEAELILSCIS